jgi:two-component system chemotaxis response regulator CheY
MAILIVDDEPNTRRSLRELIDTLGHRAILEARDGEEALRACDADGARLEMIVADWEMPYMDGLTLVRNVAARPALALTPFLLITSDLPRSKLDAFRAENPRLDACLIKPFRLAALGAAMNEAYRHRCEARATIVTLGRAPEGLEAAVGASAHWRKVVHCPEVTGIASAIEANRAELGAVIVNPSGFAGWEDPGGTKAAGEWLASFKKTPLGIGTLAVCASREPAELYPFRASCQFFLHTEGVWGPSLDELASRRLAAWELERLAREAKAALQARDLATADALARRLLELDPRNPEPLGIAGEISLLGGRSVEAAGRFGLSIEANPCQPRPYIKILETAPPEERAGWAARACAYCPENPDVLAAAGVAWLEAGDTARALGAARKALALDSGNRRATRLLERAEGKTGAGSA